MKHTLQQTLDEIVERPNPKRRHRTYPRVVKRARHNSYHVKRDTDTGTRHPGPPIIKILGLPAA